MLGTFTKMILRTALYLSLGLFFFLTLINAIQFPVTKIKTDEAPKTKAMQQVELTKEINKLKTLEQDMIDATLAKRFSLTLKEKKEESQTSFFNDITFPDYIFFSYLFDAKTKVVPMIYLLILGTFLVQIVLLSMSNYYKFLSRYISEKKLDNLFLYTSEMAVNIPPVLGVVGTMFAFGLVVSNLETISDLSTLFKENFATATLTTIIGGSVYTLNLIVNIFIAKNLTKEN